MGLIGFLDQYLVDDQDCAVGRMVVIKLLSKLIVKVSLLVSNTSNKKTLLLKDIHGFLRSNKIKCCLQLLKV